MMTELDAILHASAPMRKLWDADDAETQRLV
jgi:hypothetical protein